MLLQTDASEHQGATRSEVEV